MSESMGEHRGCLNRVLRLIAKELDQLDLDESTPTENAIAGRLVDAGFLTIKECWYDANEPSWSEYRVTDSEESD